jgi:U3 small nucleolar RNA-associated protein 3
MSYSFHFFSLPGERAISKTIMKNRGLVAHKSKLNRNPRVKKREQYRKALVRRKGQVREVRTDEGHKYGGEETGIKSGLSRSRKLGTR